MRFRSAPLLCLAVAASAWAETRSNPYDLLSQVLMPFVTVLAVHTNHSALTLAVHFERPEALAGTHATLALETPDRLRLTAPVLGEEYTLGRRGDTVWVHPGSRLRAMLERPDIAARLPAPDRKYQMRPLQLPVPEKQLFFLPALFQVREAASETVEGKACRVLDLQLSSVLKKGVDPKGWAGRLWVDAEAHPARLQVRKGDSESSMIFDQVEFPASLPPETWVPTAAQREDAVVVPPARYDQLLRAMLGAGELGRKSLWSFGRD